LAAIGLFQGALGALAHSGDSYLFAGIVIGRKGRGLNETFTVRRISYGEGVERVFPIHSPRIAKVEVDKQGRARRAKLNYLRSRKGKEATAVRE